MNTQQLLAPIFTVAIALVGFASTTLAHAGEATYDHPVSLVSSVTRAEVKAQAAQARANGEIAHGEYAYAAPTTGAMKTRAQVVAETREAVRLGLVSRGDETVFPTADQLARVELAGLNALNMTVASR